MPVIGRGKEPRFTIHDSEYGEVFQFRSAETANDFIRIQNSETQKRLSIIEEEIEVDIYGQIDIMGLSIS